MTSRTDTPRLVSGSERQWPPALLGRLPVDRAVPRRRRRHSGDRRRTRLRGLRPDGSDPPLFFAAPVAALLAIIGSVGSWVKVEVSAFGQSASESASGTEGDGTITLIIAIIARRLLGGWFGDPQPDPRVRRRRPVRHRLPAGAATTRVDPDTTEDLPNFPGLEVSAGWGVWLTTLALLALTVVSVLLALRKDGANA